MISIVAALVDHHRLQIVVRIVKNLVEAVSHLVIYVDKLVGAVNYLKDKIKENRND